MHNWILFPTPPISSPAIITSFLIISRRGWQNRNKGLAGSHSLFPTQKIRAK